MKVQSNKKSFTGETIALIDLCHAVSDCPHYTPNWVIEGGLVIRNFNIKNGRIDLTEKYYTDEATFKDRIRRHKPETGDLIISREAPMGEVCIIPENVECCLGQRTVLIKPNSKKVNNQFLLYSILSDFVQHQIKKSDGSGSIVSNLCIPDLEQLQIPVKELKEQDKIATVLSTLDTKIELNNRINSELVEMAKGIYNYWFVQFDFPDENGKPFKTNGGEMEYSQELQREIPKNWEGILLKNHLEFERGVEPGSANYFATKESDGHIPFYKVGDMESGTDTWILKQIAGSSISTEDDILISLDGTVGRMAIGLNGAFSTGIRKVFPMKGFFPKSYIYFLLGSEEIQKTIKKNATGSNILHAAKALDYLATPYNSPIVKLFDNKVTSIFKKIQRIKKENQELITLRDFLLPLLMNGQVKVKDEITENVAMAAEPKVKYGKK